MRIVVRVDMSQTVRRASRMFRLERHGVRSEVMRLRDHARAVQRVESVFARQFCRGKGVSSRDRRPPPKRAHHWSGPTASPAQPCTLPRIRSTWLAYGDEDDGGVKADFGDVVCHAQYVLLACSCAGTVRSDSAMRAKRFRSA